MDNTMGVVQIDRIVAWCKENLPPVEYEHPQLAGKMIGGEGWELYIAKNRVRAFIEDKALNMFFNLAFVKE